MGKMTVIDVKHITLLTQNIYFIMKLANVPD
jgi:hypothetical protein